MAFNRPPRIRKIIHPAIVVIADPPALSEEPKIDWMAVLLPMILMIAVFGGIAFFSGGASTSMLLFLPFILISGIVSVVNYFNQKKDYKKKVIQAKAEYSNFLEKKQNELVDITNKQRELLNEASPETMECVRWAKRQHIRLGERRPDDDDFLSFRIGLATLPSFTQIQIPQIDGKTAVFGPFFETVERYKKIYSTLREVPFTIDLKKVGCLAIAGDRDETRSLANAILVDVLAHHWLAEVEVICFCNLSSFKNWKWLKNIPHRSHLFPKESTPLVVFESSEEHIKNVNFLFEKELLRREEINRRNGSSFSQDKKPPILPATIVIFDNLKSIYDQPAISTILNKCKSLGVFGIFLQESLRDVPGECSGIIRIQNGVSTYHSIDGKEIIENISSDSLSSEEALAFSEMMAKIDWLLPASAAEPPEFLTLRDLINYPDIESVPVENWWDDLRRSHQDVLKTPIGKFSAHAQFDLDLNEDDQAHGPHGIIGGTTGSGKSELLRTIVLSYAISHHPYDINFALVDFKGGSAFMDLEKLPHVVGVVTDIENHADYATRVVLALEGEFQNREQTLQDAQARFGIAPHIQKYRELPVHKPMPHLIIIFDEFAEFQLRHPAESRKLVPFFRKGRSLGVHLILATQNPMGVVDSQILNNIKFRLSLNVSSPEYSQDFIGVSDAFDLPKGKAIFKIAVPQKFQVAYTGSKIYVDDRIILIHESGIRETIYPISAYAQRSGFIEAESDAIVKRIKQATSALGLASPPKVWMEPLEEMIYLPDVIREFGIRTLWNGNEWSGVHGNNTNPIIGIYDDPKSQEQPILFLNQQGLYSHLLVIGAPETGKSTLFINIITSISLNRTPDEVFVYCIDFSGKRSMEALENLPFLPSVGGIISNTDNERINRIFSMLRRWYSERQLLFQHQKVNNLFDYNNLALEEERLPEIYLLVDGINSMALETESMRDFPDQLDEIIRFGHSTGISVFLSTNLKRDLPNQIYNDLDIDSNALKIFLGQGQNDDAEMLLGSLPNKSNQTPNRINGRGYVKLNTVYEFQTSLPVLSPLSNQQSEFNKQVMEMNRAWSGRRPPNVDILPTYIPQSDLVSKYERDIASFPKGVSDFDVPMGVALNSWECIGFDLENDGPGFLITSTNRKLGKTTIMQSILLNLAERYNPGVIKFILIDFIHFNLKDFEKLPHIFHWNDEKIGYVSQSEDLKTVIENLENEIDQRKRTIQQLTREALSKNTSFDSQAFLRQQGLIIVVIDNVGGFLDDDLILENLAKCLEDGEKVGVRTFITENEPSLGKNDLTRHVRKFACGVCLGGSSTLELFNGAEPPYRRKTLNLPPGRGYLLRKGQVRLFQAAAYWDDNADPHENLQTRINTICKRYSVTKTE